MKYRDKNGRFRKETDEEFGKRCGEMALLFRKSANAWKGEIIRSIANSNPYADLVAGSKFGQ